MHNEKAPCPYCNELLWVGVPEGKILERLGTRRHSDGFVHNRMNCPSCNNEILVWVSKKN